MGRRVQKVVYVYGSGAWQLQKELLFVYDGWNVIEEITRQGGSDTSRYFVWGLDLSQSLQGAGGVSGLLAMVDGTNTYHYCFDANGNVSQLVNAANGEIAAHYEFDPFGNVVLQSGNMADENPFQFSTKYFDDETNLYYYGYRFYSPELGRWINRDPIEEDGSINLYLSYQNNPVSIIDYLGKKDMPSYKLAMGFTAGGSIISKFSKYGLVVGLETAVIFFPASCEVAAYSVQAGLGKNLAQWRPITEKDFPNIDEWMRFEAGLNAGIGAGFETATYIGGGIADADSFEGVFHTSQGAIAVAGLSGYVGDIDDEGGFWLGGTVTFGPKGFGVAKVDWLYRHYGNVLDIDDDLGLFGRCWCAQLRIQIAKISIADAYRNF